MKPAYINKLRGLDILRFVLSMSVIIWHYQHFFMFFIPFEQRDIFADKQPCYHLLKIFYTHGALAVQLFWIISGIIFYKIYQERIANRKTGFRLYASNRFSRLYPLHFLTLIFVGIVQICFFREYGKYFIYPNNSWGSFTENLFFAQCWGGQRGSFNGPTWSVSLEILVYGAFFLLSLSGMLTRFRNLAFVTAFFIATFLLNLLFITPQMSECFAFFFIGCLFIKVYDHLKGKNIKPYLFVACAVGIIGIVILKLTDATTILKAHMDAEQLNALVALIVAIPTIAAFLLFFNLRFFNKINDKYFQFFGDLTYSTYLLHFPIQLSLILILKPGNYEIFYAKWFFFLYLSVVVLLGRLCFLYVELPLQSWLRRKFGGREMRAGNTFSGIETIVTAP